MNIGAPDCERYQRVYRALQNGPRTSIELTKACNDCAIGTTISEMRKVGYPVSRAKFLGVHGVRRVYSYSLV